jgi:hypothetical protein
MWSNGETGWRPANSHQAEGKSGMSLPEVSPPEPQPSCAGLPMVKGMPPVQLLWPLEAQVHGPPHKVHGMVLCHGPLAPTLWGHLPHLKDHQEEWN